MTQNDFKKAILMAKYACFRRQAFPFFRELMNNQRLSPDVLEQVNWAKRKRLLDHAFERSPFYREKYKEAGLHPGDIRRPEDFQRIPFLTREELRLHHDLILTVDPRSRYLAKSSTGGSTGVPVEIFTDRRVPIEAVLWRTLGWWGLAPHMDGAYVWRMRRPAGFAQELNALAWWPTIKLKMDAASMDDRSMLDFLAAYNKLRPPLLQGYTGAISYLASEVLARGLAVHSPLAVWVTSSQLTRMNRAMIERAFKAPVYDQYGCCEVPAIAAECARREGLHINHDTVHVEFIGVDGRAVPEGATGDVVLTDLVNEVFPLIRYVNGDRGRALPGACACGICLPRMGAVQGRISDMIRLPSGRTVSGEYLTTLFDAEPDAVRQFQVRQKPDGSIALLYVPNPACARLSQAIQGVVQVLDRAIRHEVSVTVQSVAAIPHDRGKLHLVVNERDVGNTGTGETGEGETG